jgi:hypothetical protein
MGLFLTWSPALFSWPAVKRLAPTLCLIGTLAQACSAQSPSATQVKDGQQLTISGTLSMRPGGRLQFVTVTVPRMYAAGLGNGASGKPTRDIALSGYHDYALLYRHRGEKVTVTGMMQTDEASPYYRDNMSLKATSIRTASGMDLLGTPKQSERVAADVGTYDASAILPADLASPWRYEIGNQPDTRGMFSCSSNGGGDVINCHCADGFHAITASASSNATGELMDGWAQFSLPDSDREVKLNVTCSR